MDEGGGQVRERTEGALKQYVDLAHRLGLSAGYRLSVATETLPEAERLANEVNREFPRSVFFAGKLSSRWSACRPDITKSSPITTPAASP